MCPPEDDNNAIINLGSECTWLNDVSVLWVQHDVLGGMLLDPYWGGLGEADQNLPEGIAFHLGPLLQVELVACAPSPLVGWA